MGILRLTSGGHKAGIVSEPGHRHRSFQIGTRKEGDRYVPPEDWAAGTEVQAGSWWPVWVGWLAARSGPPPRLGRARGRYRLLGDVPGSYVFMP
jgi:polyhydroxyalkanoate synthase